MRKRDDMTFPFEEYERRLSELRGRMQERLLDVVVITHPQNLMYLTDYQTTGYSFFQALVVPLDEEPFMITRSMEESNVIARTWVEITRPYGDTGDAIQALVESLREFGLIEKVLGYERNSYFFPAYFQDRIHTSFSRGRLLDCFGIVEEGRVCKSEYEIEAMRKAAVATEAGMVAGYDAARAGVTENEVAGAISNAMFCAGGEFPAVMPYVTSGPRSMIGHATWEGRTVQDGEHMFLEVGGCYRRYHTAMMRTVILGELSDSMHQAQERMKQALREVKAIMRPGLTVSDADNLIRNIITDNEVGAELVTRSGYSIGIAFAPSWDEGYMMSLKQGDSRVLKEGMTFHIIPWMWGVDGDKTVGISDTVRVTSVGCESFFTLDEDFVCKPNTGSSAPKPAEKPESKSATNGSNDQPKSEPKPDKKKKKNAKKCGPTMLTATNPSSATTVREVKPVDPEQMKSIIGRAQTAFASWKETTFAQRASVLRAVAAKLREDIETLAPIMTEEMGKPIKEARGEVNKSAWCAEHYAEHAESYLATESYETDAYKTYVQHLPLGPILGILPWNAPFWLAFRFCAPALMAGNTCLMKHDPHVPGCAQALAKLFVDVGAPEGIFQNLPLSTPDVEHAIRDPRVRAVSFTGSDKGGAAVAAIAGSVVKPAVLELGGSDPSIILADADLEKAVDVITLSRIINAGQSCIAAKRLIVESSVHDKFVKLLREKLSTLKVGDPREESTDVGPIARADLRDNLHRQVRATVEEGATCELGGELPDGPGFFYPVTLLTGVTPSMTAFREETFGPVAVVIRTESEEEALKLANDTEYGLGASVWTNRERGEKLARRIEAGQVSVNGIVKTDPRVPSGGIKRSGYGRELGPHGIREFVNAQQVWVG